jgi:hypothetical protein
LVKSKNDDDSIKIKSIKSRRYGKCWEGKFIKVNVCGSKEVNISGEDQPCNSKYQHCVSYDEGCCVQIIKFTTTRYFVYE